MKTFNNSDLFTGYLKQLLHDFHLPKIKVYTDQHSKYAAEHGEERADILGTVEATPDDKTGKILTEKQLAQKNKNVRYFPYIKDGEFQEYINGKWQNIRENDIKKMSLYKYTYGDKILNYTKNLKISSNTYDSYTHEYLGDYLRFHRDYLNLDLMPLYNCFSNRGCDKINLKWLTTVGSITTTISFDSSDPNYKIYMIPVKLFQKYTIAVDSETPVEMCCGIYGDYQDKRTKFASLPRQTYKRVSKSIFSQPFLYDSLAYTSDDTTTGYIDRILDSKLADKTALIELVQNECDLKLFLKIPAQNKSTIVVLEGDYCTWNDSLWNMAENKPKAWNRSIINLDYNLKTAEDMVLITPLQLLQFNTKDQHPFADRLIEYLIGNTITNSDTEVYDNIKRAQKALTSNYHINKYTIGIPGVWSNEMRILFYEYMTSKTNPLTSSFSINHDILGYVDKDVEKFYQSSIRTNTAGDGKVSLSNIELEEGDK
jgi:hypothetical protein